MKKLFMLCALMLLFSFTAFAQDGVPPVPTDMIAIAVLSLVTMGLGLIGKKLPAINDKWIPVITAVGGAVLGLFDYYALGGALTGLAGDNAWLAGLIGGIAGMVSTWMHQVYKQQTKIS